jgi:hypothetical protein
VRSGGRHPRNLAGKGLEARLKINAALKKEEKKTSNAQRPTPNVELQKALHSPTQPELLS